MPSEVELGKSKCMCLISWSGVKIKIRMMEDGSTVCKFSWMRAWKRGILVMRREREERYVSDVLVPWF